MIKISVIIPAYNASRTIAKTLESLETQDFKRDEFEVIVVDDGSIDETKNIIDDFVKRGKIKSRCFSQKNKGPGSARNLAMENARGEIIAFTDADCIADSDWLSVIYEKIAGERKVVICGKTYTDDVILFPWKISPAGQRGITANLAIDFRILNDIYFSDIFFGLLGQDTDYLLRISDRGYPYKYIPEMRIMHPVNVLCFGKMISRCRSRMNDVMLCKVYRQRVLSSFNFIFRPILFNRISILFIALILFWSFFFILISNSMISEIIAIFLTGFILFVLYFYKFLILNNPKKIRISFYDRGKTFLFVFVYLHLLIYYRIVGSIRFRFFMV